MKTKFFSAAALGAMAAFALTASASAQVAAYGLTGNAPGVCVVNGDALIANSAAGKAANTRLQQLASVVNAELQPEATAIQNEEKALQAAVNAATTDAANKALEPRIQAFSNRRNALAQKEQLRNAELTQTRNKALTRINGEAIQAIRQVGNSKSCGVVLNGVADANPSMDLTAAATAALNARMPTITFERENLAAQAARPAQ